MAELAIRGHATRGSEVVELLNMLGGRVEGYLTCRNSDKAYFINSLGGYIQGFNLSYFGLKVRLFTLEEFLEKFPYKIGNEVMIARDGVLYVAMVKAMRWSDNIEEVLYQVGDCHNVKAVDMLPTADVKQSKENDMNVSETMKQIADAEETLVASTSQGSFQLRNEDIVDRTEIVFRKEAPDRTELVLGDDFEVVVEGGKTYVVRKQPQYPKTYEECCDVLDIEEGLWFVYEDIDGNHINSACISNYRMRRLDLYHNLEKLFICRDAYWKLAGDWRPDYSDLDIKYTIKIAEGEIYKDASLIFNSSLIFPTTEMRDAFCENFTELIVACKELL